MDAAGRIVVPERLRQCLGLKPGQSLEIRACVGRDWRYKRSGLQGLRSRLAGTRRRRLRALRGPDQVSRL